MSTPEPAPPVTVLINSGARAFKKSRRRELAAMAKMAGRELRIVEAVAIDGINDQVAGLVAEGADRIILVGGDGFAHHALQRQHNAIFGLLPSGTGNDFGRGVGVSSSVPGAFGTALLDPVDLDALVVRPAGRPDADPVRVFSVLTFGFSGEVNRWANEHDRPKGSLRYTLATFARIRKLRPLPLEVSYDGHAPTETDATLVAVANTKYFGGGMMIAPKADPTDHVFDVCSVGKVGRLELLRIFPRVYRGRHVRHPAVRMRRATHMTVRSRNDSAVVVWGDGEPIASLPIDITIEPRAVAIAGARVRASDFPERPI